VGKRFLSSKRAKQSSKCKGILSQRVKKYQPSGLGSCWDTSVKNFYFKVNMSCLLFLMSTAHFRLMPCKTNIVQTKTADHKVMAQEDPIMLPFQASAITRTKGSVQLWTNRNILQQQIWYNNLKANKYFCFSVSYL